MRPATWLSLAYLVLFGSFFAFYLILYILAHWTASATSYQFVFVPFVTVLVSSWLAGETVNPALLLGGALVLVGVWIGAFSGSSTPRLPAQIPVAEPPPLPEEPGLGNFRP